MFEEIILILILIFSHLLSANSIFHKQRGNLEYYVLLYRRQVIGQALES